MSFKKTVNVLEPDDCLTVSCRISGGQLLPALSPKLLRAGGIPDGILLAEHCEASHEFYICTPSGIYTSNRGTDFMKVSTFAGEYPFVIQTVHEGSPCAVVLSGTGAALCMNSGYSYSFSYGADLRCGVMHCGRLFGVDRENPFKICWSGEGGWKDWKQGAYGSGYVVTEPARGEISDILELGEKLVAVRKYGLTVLNMFGLPENYSVGLTDTDCEEIYRGTAQVVGGRLLFCTAGGLRSFDGTAIKPLTHTYDGDIHSPLCSAALGSKYFLSCKSKSLNGGAVLCCDVEDGGSYLIELSAEGLCSDGLSIYAFSSAGTYRLEEGGQFSFIRSGINFGSARSKTVTAMYLDGEGVDAEISNGGVSLGFKDARGLIRPRLRGESFTIKITGEKPVRALTLTAEECNAI